MRKTCTGCLTKKPLEAFHRSPTGKHGRVQKCIVCVSDYHRSYYVRVRDQKLRRQLQYSSTNRDREKERAKAWRVAHPERVRANNQRRYWSDPEIARKESLARQRRNPDQVRERGRRRKARCRNAARGTMISTDDIRHLFELHGGLCGYCGTNKANTVDHMMPIVRGGAHEIENLVPACMGCNASKGRRTALEYLMVFDFLGGRSVRV